MKLRQTSTRSKVKLSTVIFTVIVSNALIIFLQFEKREKKNYTEFSSMNNFFIIFLFIIFRSCNFYNRACSLCISFDRIFLLKLLLNISINLLLRILLSFITLATSQFYISSTVSFLFTRSIYTHDV